MAEPELVLGVPLMDEDHARLEALIAGASAAADRELPDLFRVVEAETVAHFEREEQLMKKANFPVLFCHVAQHKMILAEFAGGHRAIVSGDMQSLRNFLEVVLPQLVAAHIASVDRVTASFFKGEVSAADFVGLRIEEPCPSDRV